MLFLSFPVLRDNLNQWEKISRGEDTSLWLPTQSTATGLADSLPVKIDD